MMAKVINLETAYEQVKSDIISRSCDFTVSTNGITWSMTMSLGHNWFYRDFIIPASDNPKYIELCNLITFTYHVADIAQSRYRKEVK